MAAASKFNSVVTNPGGTGSTITPTLSTHAAGDVIEIFVSKTGNAAWSAPANWTIRHQTVSPGTASTATVGTLLYRRVLPGDTLPLASPVCTLGATVTRHAISRTIRGADIEGVYTLPEWNATGSASGTSNPIRPPSVTTLAPEVFVTHYYCQRVATNAPEPTNYTQDQEVITSGTLVTNISERTVADQGTTLSNQDVSPTSGGRWVGMITCVPSPDYPYYRAGSQAFNANATNVTPTLPTGTSSSDNRGNKDCIIATIECAGTPTIAPNTPADWAAINDWSNTTSGGGTTVRKYQALYDGTLDRQFNRSTSGEIFVYFSVYHNAHQSIPVGTSAVQQNASSTTSTFPALARTGTKATVQATCVADGTPTFTAPSGWIERNDSQGVTCADQSFNVTGTTASASFTLNSASPTLAGLMEVFSVASIINAIVTPATASLTLTSFAPTVDVDVTVTPTAVSLTLTTFTPTIITGAPFPSTPILDDFNRANGELGGNWGGQVFTGDGNLLIDSNQIRGSGSASGSNNVWDDPDVGPDCEVYVQIVTEADRSFQAFFRLTSPGGAIDGYSIRVSGSTDNVAIFLWEGGSLTGGLTNWSQTVADGDWFGARMVSDTITVYYKDVSVSSDWVQLGQITDSTHTGAGYLGLYTFDTDSAMDSFGGGTVGATVVTPATVALTTTTFTPQLRESLTPASSVLTLTTFAPTVTIAVTVTPAAALFSLTTFAPVVVASIIVTPAHASLVLTTFAVTLRKTVTPASHVLELSTFAPTLREVAIPDAALLELSTFAPTVTISADTTVTPVAAALELTTFAPMLSEVVTPSARAFALTAFAPTISTATVLTPAPATLALTTLAVVLAERTTPGTAILTVTAFAPSVIVGGGVVLTPGTAILTITSFAAALIEVATPGSRAFTLTTLVPGLMIGTTVTPASLALALTIFAPQPRTAVTPNTAILSLTMFAVSVTTSADITVGPPMAPLTLQTFAPSVRFGDFILTPASEMFTLTAHTPTASVRSIHPPFAVKIKPSSNTIIVPADDHTIRISAKP